MVVADQTQQPVRREGYDIKCVATFAGISIRHAYSLASSGRLPRGYKLGRRKLWLRSHIELWMQLGMPNADDFERELKARQGAR